MYDVDAGMAVPPPAVAVAPKAAVKAAAAAAAGDRHEEEEEGNAGGGGGTDDPDVLSLAVTPIEDATNGRLADLVGGAGTGRRECAIEAWLVGGRDEGLAAHSFLDGGAQGYRGGVWGGCGGGKGVCSRLSFLVLPGAAHLPLPLSRSPWSGAKVSALCCWGGGRGMGGGGAHPLGWWSSHC